MRYSQGQALTLLGINHSTFVYWARVIPRVRELQGKGYKFNFNDLVSLAVLRNAIQRLGITVASMSPVAGDIFRKIEQSSDIESKYFLFDGTSIEIVKSQEKISPNYCLVIIPLRCIISEINEMERQDLLPMELYIGKKKN